MPGTHAEMIARLKAERARLVERIAQVDAAIAALEPLATEEEGKALRPVRNTDNIDAMHESMNMDRRLKHSRGAAGTTETAKLRAAVRAKGDTMRTAAAKIQDDLAKVHGEGKYLVSQALLSYGAAGLRPIYQPVADAIEKRYGHKATLKNWPKLRQPPTD